jgi:hypothetical protein
MLSGRGRLLQSETLRDWFSAVYSLQRIDERARHLLLDIPDRQTEVTVISGSRSEAIANDFKAAGFADVTFRGEYFEDWVQSTNTRQ